MADDELDSLDGLDDFGSDDFGDQLDDFMDSGSEGDDVDGDSELDSFFEDLSTIDDLEVKEDIPEEEPDEEVEETVEEEEPEPVAEEPSEKKPILIPVIITAVLGMLLGGLALYLYWFFTKPVEIPKPIVPLQPVAQQAILPPAPVFATTTIPTTTLPPLPPPPPEKRKWYYVQVANCIFKECIDDYRNWLKHYGYKVNVVKQDEISPMTEVLSRQVLGEEEASRWVRRINQENQLPGEAFRIKSGNQYVISLGLFPDLNTATKVKIYLNQLYAKQLIFDAKRSEQTIHYSKMQTGRFSDRDEAIQFQKILINKDTNFKGAFVVTIVE